MGLLPRELETEFAIERSQARGKSTIKVQEWSGPGLQGMQYLRVFFLVK